MIIPPPSTPIAFYLINYPIRFYGIIMSLAFFVGVIVSFFLFKYKYSKQESEIFIDYSTILILLSLLGARICYVIASYPFYIKFPSEILNIAHGGLSIYGAIFFGLITLFFLSRIKKFDILKHADVFAVAVPLCQAIGRFGNYFNQEAYGAPSNGLIKLFVDTQYRKDSLADVNYYHPTFLYESILDILLFLLLLLLFLKFKNIKKGYLTCIYLFSYSIIRFFIEGIRIDSVLNIASIPIARYVSILIMIFSLILFAILYKKNRE